MPDYSEYVIVENEKLEFYNHYRGDYTFLCDMFWGEKEAIRIIQNQSNIKESKFDNAHSRIIIDKTNKEIFIELDTYEHDNGVGILISEIYLELLRIRWNKWKVNRLENGYDDFMKMIINLNYFEDKEYRLNRIETQVHNYENYWDEPIGTLVSISTDKEVKFGIIEKNVAEVISKGEELLNEEFTNKLPNDKLPFGGIHINLINKEVKVWYSLPSPKFGKWASKYWKNWSLEYNFNGYKNHYQESKNVEILNQIIPNLRTKAISFLRDVILDNEREPYIKIEGEKRIADFRERGISKDKRRKIFEETIEKYKKKTVPNKA
ncbi:MAG TPA: hypothetical protein PLL53_20415 [Saprospiraceae bacterium]|nr:hypothetical protein [Saprospiraceae bacterium]